MGDQFPDSYNNPVAKDLDSSKTSEMYATSKEILVPPLHAETFKSNAEDSDFYFEDVDSIPKQKVKFIRYLPHGMLPNHSSREIVSSKRRSWSNSTHKNQMIFAQN